MSANKKASFVIQLANSASPLRYKTPKTQWQAMRLGLYHTVINQKPIIRTKKLKVVRLIAKLKRFIFDEHQTKTQIFAILSNNRFKNYHSELIKECFYLYPTIFIEFFAKNTQFLANEYYHGLYLSYLSINKTNIENNQFNNWQTVNEKFLYSNLYLRKSQQKLENLNKILQTYQLSPMALIDNDKNFCVNNLTATSNHFIQKPNQVTIIVTAYNAELTLKNCVDSLLKQTYQNLQIIIVNDNSTDNTFAIMKALLKADNRIRIINLPRNTGTFVAKSIGAMIATGEFLTCQDSDDVAHPQKIERQVLPLLDNDELIATTSHWCRIDEQGDFYARQYYPFLRQNPASPLFRREQVQSEIGLWHIAKTGADSEFWERLKLVYGDERLLAIKEPLTFASHRVESLMNSAEFGVHNRKSALDRMDYWESWRLWHIDCVQTGGLFMPELQVQLTKNLFNIPLSLVVNVDDIRYNLNNYLKL